MPRGTPPIAAQTTASPLWRNCSPGDPPAPEPAMSDSSTTAAQEGDLGTGAEPARLRVHPRLPAPGCRLDAVEHLRLPGRGHADEPDRSSTCRTCVPAMHRQGARLADRRRLPTGQGRLRRTQTAWQAARGRTRRREPGPAPRPRHRRILADVGKSGPRMTAATQAASSATTRASATTCGQPERILDLHQHCGRITTHCGSGMVFDRLPRRSCSPGHAARGRQDNCALSHPGASGAERPDPPGSRRTGLDPKAAGTLDGPW